MYVCGCQCAKMILCIMPKQCALIREQFIIHLLYFMVRCHVLLNYPGLCMRHSEWMSIDMHNVSLMNIVF